MKSRIWMMSVATCFALGGALPGSAAVYYVNDTNTLGDVYTSVGGNDANSGTATNLPKLTLASVLTNAMLAGDVIYIDTGTNAPTVIGNTVNGAAGNPITIQGSTNVAFGGTIFSGAGTLFTVRGNYLRIKNVRAIGGNNGLELNGASFCEIEGVHAISNGSQSIRIVGGANSNAFRRCVGLSSSLSAFAMDATPKGNYIENCIGQSTAGSAYGLGLAGSVTGFVGNVAIGNLAMTAGRLPDAAFRNVFFTTRLATDLETVADAQNSNTNWVGNTYADPKFVNQAGLDFHLLSAAGYPTNGGGWVTNPAVGYSPAIDFGPRSASVGSEPEPNGGRADAGLYGGTAEASKSNTNKWLFAMAFNDGGTLWQTGRLEWAASTNFGAAGTVDLQYTTNGWATTNVVATGVAATNENYSWAPSFSYPAVSWRVVDPVSGVASTNAKPFSIRRATNTTFVFYVNDTSAANDVYGMGLGDDAKDGAAASRPKRTLQAIVDAYQLRGGDAVYVETGDYPGQTTTIGSFDSGSAGLPLRIVGSPYGSTFNRGNLSVDVLDLSGASNLEVENLRLAGGRYGLNGGASGITLRNLKFTGNAHGVLVTGSGHVFENCVSADNTTRSYWGTGAGLNQWRNGIMWGSPTIIFATSNSLSVSNSILVGNGPAAVLFGNQVVPGDYNLTWDVKPSSSYQTFSAFQNAGLGMGWSRSLHADPLFANATNGDFHVRSAAGRYDTNLLDYVTTDTNYSAAIDLGDPVAAHAVEPPPNGSRLNVGLYGNTAQASKSRTNAWLQVMSYMDGGTLDAQAGSWLRWNGGGAGYTNGTVTIWLSRDNGASWEATPLATNVPATNGAYWYQNSATNDSSSPFAMWRVTLDPDLATASQTPVKFDYKNGPYLFYVNDSSTNGDVYCTAVGSDTNLGSSAGMPMASLYTVINSYQLGPGDRVYVDTGAYTGTNTLVLTSQDSGLSTNPVVIQGSTNRTGGGSVFGRRTGVTDLGFVFQAGSSNIVLRDLILTNMTRGVALTNAVGVALENIEVRGGLQRAFDVQGNSRNVSLLRCVSHGGATGAYLQNATNLTIRHCLFWQNTANAVNVAGSVWGLMENSILASSNLYAALISSSSSGGFLSDYNGLHAGPLTRVGTYAGTAADNLAAWKRLSGGLDLHSIPGDPQMANPNQFDYHLKTEQTLGRLGTNGVWTSDSISSPLLDAGNPASDGSLELPAGNRVNVGRWGGTAEASIALNSLWLKTASFGDGGVATNGAVPLVWTASKGFSNETVTVEVSTDGGKTWGTTVTSGVPATNELVYWNVTNDLPDTPAGAWRVTCLESTNVSARSTNFFSIRNAPLNIFVNGVYTNNAVYATAPGKSDNWRASSNAPLDSVAAVFDRFDLEPGDQIWVDHGTYEESTPILIGMKNSGTTGDPVRVTGTPVAPYTGTVLARSSRSSGVYGIQLSRANGVQFSCLTVSNAFIGIRAEFSQGIGLDRVRVGHCFTNAVYAGDGAQINLSRIIAEHNQAVGVLTRTGSVVNIHNSLFRDNALAGLYVHGGTVEIKNSILEATGNRQFAYYRNGGTFVSDYNNVRVSEGANVAGGDTRASDRFLIDWQISTGFANDKNSFGYEPRFADEAAMDFHLKSQYGRYDPALGVFTTNDLETSRLIDLGELPPGTYADYSNEPDPNGGRINVGLYGNTVEASKSSGEPSLIPVTMSDGGTIRDEVTLYWAWNGFVGNEWVNIEFSGDGGITWTNIGHQYVNVGSTSGNTWNSTNVPSTAMGVWQVVLESDTNIYGRTETLFAVKNQSLAYYVNDASTNGDVYCSAAGSSTNTGLAPDSPLDSLSTLMARIGIDHGDTVYVDTGIYPRSSPLEISVPAIAPTNYLVIQGSTNEAAGGSAFTNSSGAVIDLQSVQYVELRDLRLLGGGPGLLLTQSSSNRILRVRSEGARGNAFELGIQSDQNRFIQCAALNFFKTGFHMATPSGATPKYATNHWINGVISPVPATTNGTAVATGALVGVQSGRLYLSNSVLVANSPGHDIYSVVQGAVSGDYNAYHRPYANSMFAKVSVPAVFGVNLLPIEHVPAWAEWNQSDSHSLIADPLFVDLAGGDLHPRSTGGHYVPATSNFVEDAETSPLIDTADPAVAWTNETAPNGKQANIGVYGGTEFASRTSSTNGSFILQTFNQGGIASGVQTLKWIAQGEVFTTAVYTVNIQISTNSGAPGTFQTIPFGTNLALAGSYVWDSSAYPSLPTIRWRVQCQQRLDWAKASEMDFAIRNTNLVYYVNDVATNDDVYCSAAGSATNTGLRADVPLNSLAAVLERYDLEPGDSVRIDTGEYSGSAAVVGYLDSGTTNAPIVIQGSTNAAGSVFNLSGIRFLNAKGILLKNIRFQSPNPAGADVSSSENVVLEHVDVSGGGNGVLITSSSNILVRNFSAAWAATNGVASVLSFNTRLEFGTIWSNGVAQVRAQNSLTGAGGGNTNASLSVSNCILGSFGIRVPVYQILGTLYANYNNLYLGNGALAALSSEAGFGREFESVGVWTSSEFGQDAMSLSHDPLFADVSASDFHLQSTTGRWVSASGWTNDAVSSPLIDAGDPLMACSEPDPNGGRVNMGRYGNTPQASRTPAEGSVMLISFNNGGRASGTNALITWLARGAATNATLHISYSADGGATWSNLVSGIPAANGYWIWDTTLSQPSVEGKLKIEGSDGSLAISAGVFSVRPGPSTHFSFYVNDDSQLGDVYCGAKGLTGNNGLTPDKPKADFNDLLSTYDLEGGDVVYIDTGVYAKGLDPWRITQADSAGNLGLDPVIFQGSTNSLMNGTVLDRRFNSIGIRADYAVGIRLRNLTVSNTVGTAVEFNDCYDAAAEWVAVGVANVGFELNAGNLLRVDHSVIVDAQQGVIATPGAITTNTVFPVIEHSVIWNMNGYAIQVPGGSATIRHNLLSATAGQYVYSRGNNATLEADYNSIWLGDSGRVFRMEASPIPLIYDTVGAWSAATGQDLHSFDGDPLLVDSTNRNFHVRSRAGRWDPGLRAWTTNDAVTSPLIDMGIRSSTAWESEPVPNGERVNVGLYGGSIWASKSETNSALNLLTLNRGGVASGPVALNWSASGASTGHTVRLEVSIDDGATWNLVAEGIQASLDGILWNSASLPSSPLGRWRVQDEVETNVVATSERPFVLHNGPVYYYVNDEYPDGDVYCEAVGDSSYSGLSPDAPKRWVSEIVDAYNLEAGDVIYVDTGFYQPSEVTTFGEFDAGGMAQSASQQINVVGSTNRAAGGSVYIMPDPSVNGFHLDNTYGIRFAHLGLMNASNGLFIDNSYFVAGEWMDIQGCGNGILVLESSNTVFTHSAMVDNQYAGIQLNSTKFDGPSLNVGSCVLWSNRYGLHLKAGTASVSNSIFGMVEPGSFGLYLEVGSEPSEAQSDYNSLFVPPQSGSAVGGIQTGGGSSLRTTVYASVSAWALASGQDGHSLAHEPQLANPGSGDFHLKSPGGRFQPGTGFIYTDTVSSPLIDSGPVRSLEWTKEPAPNGERVNIGLYGGTEEASKTPLEGWITLLTLNDGGTAAGDVELKWSVGGDATNHLICIEYSPDDGRTWMTIVCDWPAGTGSYLWDSVPFGRSALGRWRILSQQNADITAISLSRFILRNGGAIPYYVNDSSTNGDVYCSAVGSAANDGLTTNTPKASLQAIFDDYILSPEDIVFVDAGTYSAGSPPIKIDQTDSGWSNLYVTVQGSTNPVAPSIFSSPNFSAVAVLSLEYAVNIRLKNLTFRGAQTGVSAKKTIGCEFDSVRIENNRAVGLSLDECQSNRLVRSVLWKNADPPAGTAVILNQGRLAVENSVLWGSPNAIEIGIGTLTVSNSALDASGTGGRIYRFPAGGTQTFRGDYNSYTRRNFALICEQQNPNIGVGNDLYNDMPAWSAATSADRHSMTLDPAFANEVNGDFHPQSKQGRYFNGIWTNDPPQYTNSPLIDAGSSSWPVDKEPEPNGGIINIGAYGNTAQASMAQTNPPWLRAISYNDGGVMASDVLLYWLHGGMPSNTLVQLDYSTDAMISWKSIVSNLPAGTREYLWDVRSLPLSLGLNWRVVVQANTNVWDASDEPVLVKPGIYDYYVNDGGPTNLDVYCTGPGLPAGGGANPTNKAFPINSLSALLTSYPIASGDRIFVDTGTYPVSSGSPVVLDERNTGTLEFPLKIYGSTNVVAGGTRLLGNGTANGITILNTRYIELYDFRVEGAQQGMSIQNAAAITLAGMELFRNQTNGLAVSGCSGINVLNSRIWGNLQFGYYSTGSRGQESIRNNTIWGNRRGAVSTSMGLSVSNSILCVTNLAPIYVEDSKTSLILGDYNLYGLVPGSILCSNLYEKANYADLRKWQEKGRDLHSLRVVDPLFVNPAAGDFHLQSRAGYWNNGSWPVSANTSWAIDAGPPGTNEPSPNGGRINLGAYGGTPQASLSDSSVAEFLLATMSDGGVAPDGQPLYWLYRGIGPTNTISIYYSPDNGGSWLLINTGIGIGSAPYEWFSSADPTPEALWRVVLDSDTNKYGQTTNYFMHRTRPLTYYVNDNDQLGDIYTGAIGSPTNRGYVSNSPMHSIQAVLNRYQLAGGDEVKVDTGLYPLAEPVYISLFSSGDSTNRVKFTGSTNWAKGGTWMQPASGTTNEGFLFFAGHDVQLSNFRLTGFKNGISLTEGSVRCTLSDLDVQGSTDAGVWLNLVDNIRLERVLIREGLANGIRASVSPFVVESCVIWSNQASAIYMGSGAQLQMTNSVLEAFGAGRYCYEAPTNVLIQANYNDLLIRSNAQIASISGLQYEKLPQWVKATSQDRHSLGVDPQFHDLANGDFHLRSVEGRYQHGTGWTNDVPVPELPDFSPLIDMGSPQTAWSNEPTPRGNRRNIGLYGNTAQASKSNTNAWLQAVTANAGGLLNGGIKLVWGYGGNINPAAKVQLEYSYDNGAVNWIRIGEIAVGLGETYWQSDLTVFGNQIYPSSPAGRWRLYLLDDPSVVDMTDTYFGLNPPFFYYLNDLSTNNDMYATATGNDENPGFYPDVPKLTLASLLQDTDIEPGDTVYVDTGVYDMADTNAPIVWEASDGGSNGAPVLVRGSTHADRSRFIAANRFVPGYFFRMQANHVDLRDLYFAGESIEFQGSGLVVSNLSLTNRPGFLVNLAIDLRGDDSIFRDVQLDRGTFSVSGTGNLIERLTQRWGSTTLVGTNLNLVNSVVYSTNLNAIGVDAFVDASAISNCTIFSSRGTALRKRGGGTLRSGHNILVAGGSDASSVIAWEDGNLFSDWNNLSARDSAWIGSLNGKWEKLAYWQLASGRDANSVSFDTTDSFQSEAGGDFHLNSVAGRWSPLLNRWDTDTVHSVLIDLGDAAIGTGFEEMPNGYRPNLGAFGRTDKASKSTTNMWVTALSHNDGGVLKGSNVVLRWASPVTGFATSFRLEYSSDGGGTWTTIATGQGTFQGIGAYTWNTAGFEDSFNGIWRAVAEDGSGQDQTDAPFALRNQTHAFYVNDADSADDIYCSEIGSAANSGLSNSAPMLSLQQILDTYDLEGGDRVYLDTGTYSSTSDVRVIWSRGGDTNGDIVIQGNTNNPFATVLTRTGSTPAIGIDVKASYLQLRDMNVRGTDRAIRLESNRNMTVYGVVLSEAATGLDVRSSQGTEVRNSAFWKNAIGVNLVNTRTSVLENLTFALPTLAGIQMQNTVLDTLQNNIFIPDAGAYAYSIGDSISLLASATMDYNLYDFGNPASGFYAGATNYYSDPTNDPLRRWQVGKPQPDGFSGMNRDYRSAITNAGLAEINYEPLDFHPLSANGRWMANATGGDWTTGDTETSWAVDHGNPSQDYANETPDNGNRLDIGMYGNTIQASKGSTNVSLEARTLNVTNRITQFDPVYPLVWSAHMMDDSELVWVQYSGDGGSNWVTMATVSANAEYYVWTVTIDYSTAEGYWRVVSATNPDLGDQNDEPFIISFLPLRFRTSPRPTSGLMRCEWEGGLQGPRYEIRYSDDFGKTWILWDPKYNGPATINKSNFRIPSGGSKLSYTFEDRTSYLRRTRWYKIIEYKE